MTPIKHKYGYLFRGTLLRLRVYWGNGNRYIISVGYNVDKTDNKGKPKWDGRRCIKNTTHGIDRISASTINAHIECLENKLDAVFDYFEKHDIVPDVDQLRHKLNGKDYNNKNSIFKAFDEFLAEGEEIMQWSKSTLKKIKTMKKLVELFDPKASFNKIDNDWLKSLMAFQTKNSVSGKSKNEEDKGKAIMHYSGKYQNDTINKNIQNIKWFLKWASDKGYYNYSKIADFKLRYKKPTPPIIFLEWDELMRVYNLDLSKRPETARTRDMFCFCCFTSLRYSDMINLRWGNVKEDHIEVVTQKTTDKLIIDLNDYSRSILAKYKTDDAKSTDHVFGVKSVQKMNVRLKIIAKECNIDTPITKVDMSGSVRKDIIVPKWELVTTHCGRRTFISNAISLGIPPNIVMKWTGHKDYKAMLPYLGIVDKVKKSSMDKFNKI